jgi:FdhD protein
MRRVLKEREMPRETIRFYNGKSLTDISAYIVHEVPLRLYVNGELVITIACLGIHLRELAVGFLRAEGIVTGIEDLKDIRIIQGDEPTVHVTAIERQRPNQAVKTIGSSGARGKCENNEIFEELSHPGMPLYPEQILKLLEQLDAAATIQEAAKGTHCSGLADSSGLIVAREDIGRHNTIDMLGGYMLLEGIGGADKALVTTGRISSEIVLKVRRMGIPVIVSHASTTTRALTLCKDLGMTLVGSVRGGKFKVYANGSRIEDRGS